MALPSAGRPGPPRPKSSPSLPPQPSFQPHIFSPSPTQPHTNWMHLLSSTSPGPMPFALPPAALADLPSTEPHAGLALSTCCPQTLAPIRDDIIPDNTLISSLADTLPAPSSTDPWHRAHARNCAHATAACAACSISLICCSCRSLRFTPGPAPTSPVMLPVKRSHSTSPTPMLMRKPSPTRIHAIIVLVRMVLTPRLATP